VSSSWIRRLFTILLTVCQGKFNFKFFESEFSIEIISQQTFLKQTLNFLFFFVSKYLKNIFISNESFRGNKTMSLMIKLVPQNFTHFIKIYADISLRFFNPNNIADQNFFPLFSTIRTFLF
jgi:hypothetical protein